MQIRSTRRSFALLLCGLLGGAGSCSSQAADPPAAAPSTVEAAAKLLNLAEFPLPNGAESPQRRYLAGLSYKTPGTVKSVFEFQRKQLADKKWKELPGGYASDDSTNGAFSRDGYTLSIAVSSTGQPGSVSVTIQNHGNVRLDKLPVPAEAKPLFVGPAIAMYVADLPADQATDACRKLLLADGWQPYGKAGDAEFFKRNAVKLTAFIRAAPAQGGKTAINYSTVLMSVDLPAPADAIEVRYADVTATLSFDSEAPTAAVVDYYKTTLGKADWNATTEKPFDDGFKKMMIFRNPAKDMLTLEMADVDGKTRVLLKHQSAAEIEEIERLIREEAAAKKKAKEEGK